MAFESLRPHADLILRHAPPHGRLSDLVGLLRQRHGVTTTAGTLSKFISELRLSTPQPSPRVAGTPPPPLPPQAPQPPPPIDVNLLMGDVLAELEGTRVELREHMAKLAGKAAVIDAEVQEMGKAVEELVDIGTRPPDPAPPTVQWGATRETVKRIWQSALFITATAWLAVIMLVSWQMPEVASAFLTRLGVKPEKVVQTLPIPLPGPERVKIERIEVKVPGPERITVQKVEVPVPGPERVRTERVEVPGQCSVKPLYTVPDSKETEKLDAACDALASARSSGIAPARRTAAMPATPPTPSPTPQAKIAEPEKPVALIPSPAIVPSSADPTVKGDDVRSEIQVWFNKDRRVDELIRNTDLFQSLCRAMFNVKAAIETKVSSAAIKFTSYEQKLWNEELDMCRQSDDKFNFRKSDPSLFEDSPHRPKNMSSSQLPSPPSTNSLVAAVGFDVACKGIRLSGLQDPFAWPCQLVARWRKHWQLMSSPVKFD